MKIPDNLICFLIGLCPDYLGYRGSGFYSNQAKQVYIFRKILDFYKYEYEIIHTQNFEIKCNDFTAESAKFISTDKNHTGGFIINFGIMSDEQQFYYFLGCNFSMTEEKTLIGFNCVNKHPFLNHFFTNENIEFKEHIHPTSIPTVYTFENIRFPEEKL
jgi:hypothetical protein